MPGDPLEPGLARGRRRLADGAERADELRGDRELTPDAARDLGWIDPPARLTVRLRDRENPLDPAALAVTLNGQPTVATSQAEEGGKGLTVTLDLATLLAADRARPRRQRIEIAVADRSVARHRTVVAVSFINRVPLEEGVVYLSDLKPARAFAHGGLILDRDYVGNMAEIQGRVYPKGLTLCPEAPAGWAEVVYALPPDRPDPLFLAEVGLTESSRGAGSATFLVQRGPAADGPWETLYTSPTLRGGMAPVAVELRLGGAKYLRLYTTDAGDGINSDHAFYGAARLR
ncbi:MAG: NPCBM/NEW2 domain-containing protein [Armatimonadetes bacterium]|nr:NPCBM/NEW2 domain-containing protein [Armatimonadota bacterium]